MKICIHIYTYTAPLSTLNKAFSTTPYKTYIPQKLKLYIWGKKNKQFTLPEFNKSSNYKQFTIIEYF